MRKFSERLAVFFDERIFDHDTDHGFFDGNASPYLPVAERHPENAERVRNMHGILANGPIKDHIDWHDAPVASEAAMGLFHDDAYLKELAALAADRKHWCTSTTPFGPGSYDAVRVSAGLAVGAAEHVWLGKGKIAYALCRPPGHHAQPARTDGYCFVNNIGVAIEVLRAKGLRRAAVIDWDVHHGNGTQAGFYADPDILTISMHMDHGAWGDSHPQTGAADEVGIDAGKGANLNIPLPYGSGDSAHFRAFDEIITPAVQAFRPQVLVVAAGQDANQFDPNGRQNVTMAGFHGLGLRARKLAAELTDGKLVLVQEGGYSISYAAYCLHATLEGVLGLRSSLDDPIAFLPDHTHGLEAALREILETRRSVLEL
ncbi:MAG: class II histone deacetylase [Proteobacteria bacterium]|nr:MAG: class II histone deacetylase [Pseudomonadota bacterium]TDJ68416.1 MAG: class II histone deacetylase [Pseudomonadota bacterium]